MKTQNYSNHSRWVNLYHFVTFLAILLLIIGAIRNLVTTNDENLYPPVLLVLLSFIVLFIFFFTRTFALKAQDRAIRAEEKLRYYILSGKAMNSKLTTRQIIGLRFASDEEFVVLCKKAVKENLSEKEIKKSIKNWKPDYYRV